ncbi:MAG: hypothetical protein ACKOSS_01765 [Planctomycetia bacterium]
MPRTAAAPEPLPAAPGCAAPGGAAPREVSLRRRLLPASLLALLLGVAGVGALVHCSPAREPQTVAEAWAVLQQRAPAAVEALAPITAAELAAAQPPARDTLSLVAPRGLLSDERPRIRWGGVPPTETVLLELRTPEGEVRWRYGAVGGMLEWPRDLALASAGRYEMVVSAGGRTASASFELAAPEARARLQAALDAVHAHVPARLQPLVGAHACARLGWWLAAEARAQEALRANARDREALDLLRWVHAQLGEAATWAGYAR